MFDVYMEAHALDPSVRRRMTLALAAAAIASAAAIAMYTGAQRLGVARVVAPKVEVEFLLATAAPPPVAAPPPDAPAAALVPTSATPDDAPPPRREPQADSAPIEDPEARPRSPAPPNGVPTGKGPGVPGPLGVPGIPGAPCIPGACVVGGPRALPPALPRVDDEPAKLAMSVVQGRATVSPDPSREALAATRAGAAGRGGTTVVAFCVGTDGKVDSTQTKRSAGDADVDRICRDTIRRWRFTPYEVGGRAKRMCSEYTFVIEFD
jgi:protein TonB